MADYEIASITMASEPSISYIRDCARPAEPPVEVRDGPPQNVLYIVADSTKQPARVVVNGVRYEPTHA